MTRYSKRNTVSRRRFLSATILAGAMLPFAAACGKKENAGQLPDATTSPSDCRDLSGVSAEDLAIREKLAYVNESPIPENECSNCNLYLPPTDERKCGGCMLFKGPVEAKGYCTYWAPKIEG